MLCSLWVGRKCRTRGWSLSREMTLMSVLWPHMVWHSCIKQRKTLHLFPKDLSESCWQNAGSHPLIIRGKTGSTVWKGEPQERITTKVNPLSSWDLNGLLDKLSPAKTSFINGCLFSTVHLTLIREWKPVLKTMDLVTCDYCGQCLVPLSQVVWLRWCFLSTQQPSTVLLPAHRGAWSGFLLSQNQGEVLKLPFFKKNTFSFSLTKMGTVLLGNTDLSPNSGKHHLLFSDENSLCIKDRNKKDSSQSHEAA